MEIDRRSKLVVPIDVAHRLLAPRLVCLIGSQSKGDDSKWNVCPISNVMSVSNNPQRVAIAIFKEWTTYKNIKGTREFSVNVPDETILDEVWFSAHRYNGLTYPAGIDKMKLTHLTAEKPSQISVPTIRECFANLECKVFTDVDMGDHQLFVGSVVSAKLRRDLKTKEWRLPLSDVAPVLQNSGNLLMVPGREIVLDSIRYQEELDRRSKESQASQ